MENADGYVIIGTELDTTGVDKGIEDIKKEHDNETLDFKTKESETSLKKILGFSKRIGRSFLGISATTARFLGSIIKVVAKLGMLGGVLGIVALIGYGIASAFKEAINQDKELESKIEYLKFAMKSAFETIGSVLINVFKWIIDAISEILTLLAGVIKLITGVNIFAKATSENFKKANKNASALKKTLTGFDKINILNKDGTTGLSGGFTPPDDDFMTATEDWAKKIKKWFLGDGYDTFGEALVGNIKDIPSNMAKMFKPIYDYVLDPYIVKPFEQMSKNLEPIWNPIKNKFEEIIGEVETRWGVFIDFLQPSVINPVEEKFTGLKDDLTETFAPFFNKIIEWINQAFGIFGVHIDKIKTKSDEASSAVESGLGGALGDVKKKADALSEKKFKIDIDTKQIDNSNTWIANINTGLKTLTGKTWKISTSFTSTTDKKTTNSWLDPIRKQLAKVGVNLPLLAVGGIVNMPGRGVNYGGATIGERGAEGVIPLTDNIALEKIGNAIGKNTHITINLTNEMDGRVVARILKDINNENNFARNGG